MINSEALDPCQGKYEGRNICDSVSSVCAESLLKECLLKGGGGAEYVLCFAGFFKIFIRVDFRDAARGVSSFLRMQSCRDVSPQM